MDVEIDTIRSELQKARYISELEYLKTTTNLNLMENHLDVDIDNRIHILERITTGITSTTIQSKKDDLFREIDKYLYKKLWNKLGTFHKIVKMKEYIKATYGEGELQTKMTTELVEMIDTGKLNTKKAVIYDPNAEKILSIPILTVELENNTYTVKAI